MNTICLDIKKELPVFNVLSLNDIPFYTDDNGMFIQKKNMLFKAIHINDMNPYEGLASVSTKYDFLLEHSSKLERMSLLNPKVKRCGLENRVVQQAHSILLKIPDISKFNYDSIKIEHLILDLSGNMGGALADLQMFASLFVGPQKLICYLCDGKEIFYLKTIAEKKFYFDRLTLVIDGQTASSAEILVLALKKYFNATLLGTESTGKFEATIIRKVGGYYVKIPKYYVCNEDKTAVSKNDIIPTGLFIKGE